MKRRAEFKWQPLSKKQRTIFKWWLHPDLKDRDGIIADGSIRSGKTVSMSMSFVVWAMHEFDRQNFAMCGKTIASLRRNVLVTLKRQLRAEGYTAKERKSENLLIVSKGSKVNSFYLFGGKDEASQDLIQGITLAGAFFDEVALMPESFVNQATGRCSVDGSKWWFNCNPASPFHWFYVNWIKRAKERNLLYLHFTMADNLTLSKKIRDRYASQYSGVFYKRFILGLWVIAEGIIYRCFDKDKHVLKEAPNTTGDYIVSSDYGIQNANVFLLWRNEAGSSRWVCLDECVWSGRDEQEEKSVKELADMLDEMLGDRKPKFIIIDPSASAMKVELRRRGYKTRDAVNDVKDGIENVITMLMQGRLIFMKWCKNTIREFGLYSWDEKASMRGEDKPIKANDHCMDAVRYFVTTMNLVRKEPRTGAKPKDLYFL